MSVKGSRARVTGRNSARRRTENERTATPPGETARTRSRCSRRAAGWMTPTATIWSRASSRTFPRGTILSTSAVAREVCATRILAIFRCPPRPSLLKVSNMKLVMINPYAAGG